MIVRRLLLAAGLAALTTTPAWALPAQAPSNQGTAHAPTTPAGPPTTTPNDGDHGQGGDHAGGGQNGNAPDHPGKPSSPGHSHKCTPHKVAYVASGLLVSQTLTLDGASPPPTTTAFVAALHPDAGNRYSGDVTVDVKHTNHHAAGDKGKTVTYTVSHARVTFALPDVNNDGSSGLDDLQAGDRVKVIGKVTALARRCDHSGFTPTTTIRHIVFHGPPSTSAG
jgi:hypothetical protein